MAEDAASPGRNVRLAASCGIAGPILFTVAWVALGAAWPGYDPVAQYISELAAAGAPRAGVMVAAFLALGLLELVFAAGLQRGVAAGAGAFLGPALIGLFGAATVGSGLFRCDRGCGGTSFANGAHNAITHVGLGALVLAALVLPLRLGGDGRWRGYRWYCWLTGLTAAAIFARGFETFGGVGLGQRLFIGVLFLWLDVLAIRLYRIASV